MRSDNHINVGRMTDFSFVTWACIYAPVRTELSVTCHWARARDISYYPFRPCHSHRKASSCYLLGRAVLPGSPRGARHSPSACARLLNNSIHDSLQFSIHVLGDDGDLHSLTLTVTVIDLAILTLILIFCTPVSPDSPSNCDSPRTRRLLVRSATLHFKTGLGALSP